MSAFHDVILAGASGSQGYQISRSVRLRSSASAYFNRTYGIPTAGTKYTVSMWVKRGQLGRLQGLIGVYPASSPSDSNTQILEFNASDQLSFSGFSTLWRVTNAVYRDPSAWYHIVLAYDSTQATASNRELLYVNGVQVTSFATSNDVAQNTVSPLNSNGAGVYIGQEGAAALGSARYLDGYLTEVNFIDGQALTPSSFGETDAVTGVWKPKKYTGTYGTNGFYLNFSDNSAATAAAIGKDYSNASSSVIVGSSTNASTTLTVVSITGISVGNIVSGPGIPSNTYVTAIGVLQVTMSQAATSTNASQNYTFSGNNWTPNNISVTAGVTYDSMLDVPTPYADGGNGRGNYSVMNPLAIGANSSQITFSNANLTATWSSTAGYATAIGTIGVSSGKWYWEVINTTTANSNIGVVRDGDSLAAYVGQTANGYSVYSGNGNKYNNGSAVAYTSAIAQNDVVGVALDMDAGTLTLYKNGTSLGQAYSGLSGTFFPAVSDGDTSATVSFAVNFGQRPFTYTPPTGFKALNTQNLPEPTIKKGNQYFDATIYTGNGSALTVTNSGSMQPDLLWTKQRSSTAWNYLQDAVRGVNKALFSNATDAEYSITPTTTTLNSNGFSFNGAESGLNANGATYVAWQWKESASAGFDIVTYTGTGANRTVAHNLGVAPRMMIIKRRDAAGNNWNVYHASIGNTTAVLLNDIAASQTPSAAYWNNTTPTSTEFTLGTGGNGNANGATYVAYLFSEVAGFSRFGSYTGNGSSDGPFVYCGFRPRYLLIKRTDSASSLGWFIFDTARNPNNIANLNLYANSSSAEATDAGGPDLLSNGFKLRGNGTDTNASGGTYIYAAFSEVGFKYALGR